MQKISQIQAALKKLSYLKQYQSVGWNNAVLYYPLIGELVYQVMRAYQGKGIDSFSSDGIRFNIATSFYNIDPFNETFQFLKNMKTDSAEWSFLHEIIEEFYQKMSAWFVKHWLRQIFLKDIYFDAEKLQEFPLSVQLYKQGKFLVYALYEMMIKNSNNQEFMQDFMRMQDWIFDPILFK